MFEFFITIFDVILYNPLFNALVALYDYIPGHDFGIAIIALTLIIKIILYPLSVKAFQSQRNLQSLQPKLAGIQKQYKDDKEKQARETFELYRKEKINPFSGLLLSLVQLPILIALYRVFWGGLKAGTAQNLYSFVSKPGVINPVFLHVIDLSKANIIFAVLAGILQYFQTKMLLPNQSKKSSDDVAAIMQKQMTYLFPVITIIILFNLPSALGLYWIVSSLFSIIQQYVIIKNSTKVTDKTLAESAS